MAAGLVCDKGRALIGLAVDDAIRRGSWCINHGHGPVGEAAHSGALYSGHGLRVPPFRSGTRLGLSLSLHAKLSIGLSAAAPVLGRALCLNGRPTGTEQEGLVSTLGESMGRAERPTLGATLRETGNSM